MNKRLQRLSRWGLLLWPAAFAAPVFAGSSVQVPTAQQVEWSGNHKVFYSPGYDLTWVFFENSSGFSYEAYNGVKWVNGGVAISTTEVTNQVPVTNMYGAVF